MDTLQLEGILAKVERARGTLANLTTEIDKHRESEVRRLETAIGQRDLMAMDFDEPETLYGYAIAVGEIAYNLRSSLDHLVWQLVLSNGQTPNKRSEFPIFHSEDDYQTWGKSRMRGLTDNQMLMIEGLQPFRDATDIGPHLWMLYTICNIDKHRHLNIVSTHSVISARVEGEVPDGLLPGSLSRGLVLHDVLEGSGYEYLVKDDVIVDVCFRDSELEDASPGYRSLIETEGIIARPPVIPVLQSCSAAVEKVVTQFSGEYAGC